MVFAEFMFPLSCTDSISVSMGMYTASDNGLFLDYSQLFANIIQCLLEVQRTSFKYNRLTDSLE